MNTILKINNCNKHFNGIIALNDFNCEITENEIVGLIGPNGAGKSTLFNVLTGFIQQDSGEMFFKGKDISTYPAHRINNLGISRTFQDLRLIRQMTVLENILLSFHRQPGEHLENVFFRAMKVKLVEALNREQAMELLKYAGIENKANDLADDLSYGQQKLLSIICCLATDADLLLLDEPIAGINPTLIEKILSLISELPKQGKSILLIEHNMDVISQICDRVIFMDSGKKVSEGTAEEVKNDPRVIEAYLD
ncbi:MAG: ABC transporter ATP-binding protein [Candidatus Delongbacteria bacterium]|nr:ABC transporter ATP-binding protein [Candidatus Delongbacteria bacterium]